MIQKLKSSRIVKSEKYIFDEQIIKGKEKLQNLLPGENILWSCEGVDSIYSNDGVCGRLYLTNYRLVYSPVKRLKKSKLALSIGLGALNRAKEQLGESGFIKSFYYYNHVEGYVQKTQFYATDIGEADSHGKLNYEFVFYRVWKERPAVDWKEPICPHLLKAVNIFSTTLLARRPYRTFYDSNSQEIRSKLINSRTGSLILLENEVLQAKFEKITFVRIGISTIGVLFVTSRRFVSIYPSYKGCITCSIPYNSTCQLLFGQNAVYGFMCQITYKNETWAGKEDKISLKFGNERKLNELYDFLTVVFKTFDTKPDYGEFYEIFTNQQANEDLSRLESEMKFNASFGTRVNILECIKLNENAEDIQLAYDEELNCANTQDGKEEQVELEFDRYTQLAMERHNTPTEDLWNCSVAI